MYEQRTARKTEVANLISNQADYKEFVALKIDLNRNFTFSQKE